MLDFNNKVDQIKEKIKIAEDNCDFDKSEKLFSEWEDLHNARFPPEEEAKEEVVEEKPLTLKMVFKRYYSVVSPLR